ncbi:CPBP family intramembrane glutamic endopeptidase [Paludifilum halophilum]|uniref:CAAX prenyl protease 2/Lysostaphin resistance protein A-like domain-containing protein n=1 Tax=Paludifilum halophilum TaxID=1642702 RepID=A0A235BBE8_9BACL|nr:type II CAAX endopeptidase family protein [Paludifilum halophilum]OYD08885.1 hypothetical protein CHM34_03630 [Paludifilum halophilum]
MKWIALSAQVIVTIILAFAGVLLFSLALSPWFPLGRSTIPLIFAQNTAFIGAALVSWRWFEKRPMAEMGFRDPAPFYAFLRGSGIGLLLIGGLFLFLWMTPWMEVTGWRLDSATLSSLIYAGIAFLAVAIGEEVFTRGYLQTLLTTHGGTIAGIVLSSLVFSALHLQNPHTATLPMINLFVAGIFLGTARWISGSLWLPIGLHFTWNWTQETLSLPVSGLHLTSSPPVSAKETGPDWITGGPFGLEGGVMILLVMAAVIGWWVWSVRKS